MERAESHRRTGSRDWRSHLEEAIEEAFDRLQDLLSTADAVDVEEDDEENGIHEDEDEDEEGYAAMHPRHRRGSSLGEILARFRGLITHSDDGRVNKMTAEEEKIVMHENPAATPRSEATERDMEVALSLPFRTRGAVGLARGQSLPYGWSLAEHVGESSDDHYWYGLLLPWPEAVLSRGGYASPFFLRAGAKGGQGGALGIGERAWNAVLDDHAHLRASWCLREDGGFEGVTRFSRVLLLCASFSCRLAVCAALSAFVHAGESYGEDCFGRSSEGACADLGRSALDPSRELCYWDGVRCVPSGADGASVMSALGVGALAMLLSAPFDLLLSSFFERGVLSQSPYRPVSDAEREAYDDFRRRRQRSLEVLEAATAEELRRLRSDASKLGPYLSLPPPLFRWRVRRSVREVGLLAAQFDAQDMRMRRWLHSKAPHSSQRARALALRRRVVRARKWVLLRIAMRDALPPIAARVFQANVEALPLEEPASLGARRAAVASLLLFVLACFAWAAASAGYGAPGDGPRLEFLLAALLAEALLFLLLRPLRIVVTKVLLPEAVRREVQAGRVLRDCPKYSTAPIFARRHPQLVRGLGRLFQEARAPSAAANDDERSVRSTASSGRRSRQLHELRSSMSEAKRTSRSPGDDEKRQPAGAERAAPRGSALSVEDFKRALLEEPSERKSYGSESLESVIIFETDADGRALSPGPRGVDDLANSLARLPVQQVGDLLRGGGGEAIARRLLLGAFGPVLLAPRAAQALLIEQVLPFLLAYLLLWGLGVQAQDGEALWMLSLAVFGLAVLLAASLLLALYFEAGGAEALQSLSAELRSLAAKAAALEPPPSLSRSAAQSWNNASERGSDGDDLFSSPDRTLTPASRLATPEMLDVHEVRHLEKSSEGSL